MIINLALFHRSNSSLRNAGDSAFLILPPDAGCVPPQPGGQNLPYAFGASGLVSDGAMAVNPEPWPGRVLRPRRYCIGEYCSSSGLQRSRTQDPVDPAFPTSLNWKGRSALRIGLKHSPQLRSYLAGHPPGAGFFAFINWRERCSSVGSCGVYFFLRSSTQAIARHPRHLPRPPAGDTGVINGIITDLLNPARLVQSGLDPPGQSSTRSIVLLFGSDHGVAQFIRLTKLGPSWWPMPRQ